MKTERLTKSEKKQAKQARNIRKNKRYTWQQLENKDE